jgi:hypothetical protein
VTRTVSQLWYHKPPPLFIEVPVPSEKSEQPCICVLGVSTKPGQRAAMYLCVWGLDFAFSYAFDSGFWNCSNSVAFFYFHFISNLKKKKKKKNTV